MCCILQYRCTQTQIYTHTLAEAELLGILCASLTIKLQSLQYSNAFRLDIIPSTSECAKRMQWIGIAFLSCVYVRCVLYAINEKCSYSMRRTSFSFHCTRYCSNITVLARSIDTNHFGTYLILNFIMAIYICVTRPLLQQRRHPRRHVRQLPSTIYFSTILFRNGKVDTDSLYLH